MNNNIPKPVSSIDVFPYELKRISLSGKTLCEVAKYFHNFKATYKDVAMRIRLCLQDSYGDKMIRPDTDSIYFAPNELAEQKFAESIVVKRVTTFPDSMQQGAEVTIVFVCHIGDADLDMHSVPLEEMTDALSLILINSHNRHEQMAKMTSVPESVLVQHDLDFGVEAK